MDNTKFKEALTHFNRVGGQLKRNHDLDPADYLKGVHTIKGIERALDRMRYDAEREDLDRAIDEYEQRFNDALEEKLKQEDLEAKEDQYEQARESLNENWDLEWDETDSRIFWDAFDDSDLIDAFGSEQILDMGDIALNDDKITTKQAADLAKRVAASSLGSGMSNAEKRDAYDTYINEYKKMRWDEKGRQIITHSEAADTLSNRADIQKLFDKKDD